MSRAALLLPTALILAGCGDGEPQGQVAARVAGIEITDRELAGEAAATGADLRQPAARAVTLNRLIDRKLLARAAQAAFADRTPAVQIDMRRAREDVLARAYAQRIAAQTTPPEPDAIDRFMRANPHRFAARKSYVVDQLTVADAAASVFGGLAANAAAVALDRSATPYRRQLVLIDSDTLNAAASDALAGMAIGATRRTRIGGAVTIDTLLIRQPVRETQDLQRARARAIIEHSASAAAIDASIRSLRADANIAIRDDRTEVGR